MKSAVDLKSLQGGRSYRPNAKPSFRPMGSQDPRPRRRRVQPDFRYARLINAQVVHVPAGSLHFDPSVRRKWLARLVKTPNLSSGARALASLLAARSSDHGKYCWGMQTKIAEELGVTERSIRNWCGELERAGLVVVERCKPYFNEALGRGSRRHTNRYHLVVDLRDFTKKIREFTPIEARTEQPTLVQPDAVYLPEPRVEHLPEQAQAPPSGPPGPLQMPPGIKALRSELRGRHGHRGRTS